MASEDGNPAPPGESGNFDHLDKHKKVPPGLAKKNKVPPGHDPNHPKGKDTDGVIDTDDIETEPGEPFAPDDQEPIADSRPPENPNPTT